MFTDMIRCSLHLVSRVLCYFSPSNSISTLMRQIITNRYVCPSFCMRTLNSFPISYPLLSIALVSTHFNQRHASVASLSSKRVHRWANIGFIGQAVVRCNITERFSFQQRTTIDMSSAHLKYIYFFVIKIEITGVWSRKRFWKTLIDNISLFINVIWCQYKVLNSQTMNRWAKVQIHKIQNV